MKVLQYVPERPFKFWCSAKDFAVVDGNDKLISQINNVCRLPFLHKHAAFMADTHAGYGMPIGGVVAALNYVIPNGVGKDIGCGMISYKTGLKASELIDMNVRKSFANRIRELIPVGMKWHNSGLVSDLPFLNETYTIPRQQYENAALQLGTLGSGNHFIEFQHDDDSNLYFMIHSGSRNVGSKTADYHDGIARKINKKYFSTIDLKWELAFLPVDSQEGQNYIQDMLWCLDFAKANRKRMMLKVCEAFNDVVGGLEFNPLNFLDVHHNYASLEHHFNKNVWVHRKGATRAYEGELGIIPGSQGTNSYIVEGLGNKESFKSCSHGAGRKMGRKDAIRKLDYKQELDKLDGIMHTIRSKKHLDEAVGSYKNINQVMENQKDLVKIKTKLYPFGCIKSDDR